VNLRERDHDTGYSHWTDRGRRGGERRKHASFPSRESLRKKEGKENKREGEGREALKGYQ
jgi:hypothetical protein